MQSIKTDIVKPIDKSIIVLSDIDCIGQSIEIDGNNFSSSTLSILST